MHSRTEKEFRCIFRTLYLCSLIFASFTEKKTKLKHNYTGGILFSAFAKQYQTFLAALRERIESQ